MNHPALPTPHRQGRPQFRGAWLHGQEGLRADDAQHHGHTYLAYPVCGDEPCIGGKGKDNAPFRARNSLMHRPLRRAHSTFRHGLRQQERCAGPRRVPGFPARRRRSYRRRNKSIVSLDPIPAPVPDGSSGRQTRPPAPRLPRPCCLRCRVGINDTNGAASQEVARSSTGGFHAEGHLGAVGAPLVRSVGRPSLASALRDPARGGILA